MKNWLRQFEYDKSMENLQAEAILTRPDIADFKEFTGLPKYQAAMLAILCNIRKKARWVKTLDFLQVANDQLPGFPVDRGFEMLIIGKWIRTVSDGNATGDESVRLTPDVEFAFQKSQPWLLPKKKAKDVYYPLRKMYAVAASVRRGNRSVSDWIDLVNSSAIRGRSALGRFFAESELTETEVAISLFVTALSMYENVPIEQSLVLSVFAPDPLERHDLCMSLSNSQHALFTSGILESDSGWRGQNVLKPGMKLVSVIRPVNTLSAQRDIPVALQERKCASIPDVQLAFDEELNGQLEIVKQLCKPDVFSKYASTQIKTGQFPGMGILLSGEPGTGKTEYCHQLARATGRDLLVFDVASARNKYFGETEKAVKGIFDAYRRIVKQEKAFPILLFNEGDSIFQKRGDEESNVQQTENAIQTILLNELERFEGILLVTTNKPHFFDEAFDRRFLYKCKFGLPSEGIRTKLLLNVFPDISIGVAEQLAANYVFTAAELQNFKKQQFINELVLNQRQKIESELEQYLARTGKSSSRKHIGFAFSVRPENATHLFAA